MNLMTSAQSSMITNGSARVFMLEERVNQTAAHYLTTLTVDDLRKYNPSSAHHSKTNEDAEIALNKLRFSLRPLLDLWSQGAPFCDSV